MRSEKSKGEEVGSSSTIDLKTPVSGILNFTSCHLLDTHNLAFAPRLLAPFIQQKNERRTASCGTVPGAVDLGRGSVRTGLFILYMRSAVGLFALDVSLTCKPDQKMRCRLELRWHGMAIRYSTPTQMLLRL